MENNKNISVPRIQMIKLLLSELKSNIDRKLIQIYNLLQIVNKSKIELKKSILKIKLISLNDIDKLNILKGDSIIKITETLDIFKIHVHNTLQLVRSINSIIVSKQYWNNCFSNYCEYLTDSFYKIEEITDFEQINKMILNLVIQNGEDAINIASDNESDIKTFKNKIVVFYIMIINTMEVIINEIGKMETFLYANIQTS